MATNRKRGGLASTSPQAETAGGESCSFSGFNDYHHHGDEEDEEEGDEEGFTRNGEGGNS